MEKLLFRWSELKTTFWFVPVILIFSSILLSTGLVYLDEHIDIAEDGLGRYFFVNSPDSARSILSTISGAMMGVAGTVFSITLVALTLASSQFGPRLIKNFMYVRLNQVVLGAYISTYLYCLLVLNAVRDVDEAIFIPSISIFVAIIAAVTNIILLVVFIHQISISLQADKIISDISEFNSKQIKRLFSEKDGEDKGEKKDIEANIDLSKITSDYERRISIKSPKSNYLQYIDRESLTEILRKKNSLLELYFRPGGHLVAGEELGLLYTSSDWEEQELEKINKAFVTGKTRTSQQDLEYSIHQMVEIALRALSPGINDPYTAIACIDNLTATMCFLAEAKFPSKYFFDDEGDLRMIAETLEFKGILDAAFNQIRQFSGGSPAVMIRLMEALTTILKFTNDEGNKKAVIKHAEMVLNTGKQSINEENDLDDLIQRSIKILK